VNEVLTGGARPLRIAINGIGRIGRSVFRLALQKPTLQVVAVNDLAGPEVVAHQLHYDSTLGPFPGAIALDGESLVADGQRVLLVNRQDPETLPWRELGIDVVIEATGRFTARERAAAHLRAGAGRVVISAPAADADFMVVLGVNHGLLDPLRHRVVSNASCTTNCLAPMVKVLNDTFGLRQAQFTTVHPYTNNQQLHDSPHQDLRRGRGAGRSMIPTTTTAVAALWQVLPETKGRVDGMAVRVPTAAVANIDLVAELARPVTVEAVNDAFRAAAAGELAGIMGIAEEELVSCDFRGSRCSAVLDAPLTQVVSGNLVRILAWYDNETGYSSRLVDLLGVLGR
jgi:glyceraldehyde 3-phosphate dehydrogenase